ncbi:phage major capsid protein [Marinifilum sp. JC120]|nr:phage major capsid protein [Marinifilum sp. JC120]
MKRRAATMPEQRTKPTLDAVQGCRRAYFPVEGVRAIDEEKRIVEVAFSSDAELEQWWRTNLILEHTEKAVRLKRLNDGGAVLFNHKRDDHLGVVETARIDADGKGRAEVRFGKGKRADEKYNDVLDGILRHISVGFDIHEVKLVETRDDDLDVYRATDWEPYEISFVTIPLDHSVGVGRDNTFKEGEMPKPNGTPEDAGGGVNESAIREKALNDERERTNALLKIGRDYNAPEDAQRFVSEGKTPDQFRQFLLEKLDARGQADEATPDEMNEPIGLTEREIQNYSFCKALRALDPNNNEARDAAGFELDVSRAAAQKMGRDAQGIMVPPEVLTTPLLRTYTTGTGSAPHGGVLVDTNLLADSFIDMLRARCLLMGLGTKLAGLVGNIEIPKQLAGAQGYVVNEDEDTTGSEGDFGQVKMSPSTIGALSEISRRLLMQNSLDVEAFVRRDLAIALAHKLDDLGYYGTGVDEPLGLKNTTGVNAVLFATAGKPTFQEIIQMETEVSADNADVDSMAYLFGARMRGTFKGTLKVPGVAGFIWEQGNTVNGYNVGVTNKVATGDVFFGNYSDLFVGLWGGLDLTLDPYTHSAKGRLRIIAMQDSDFAARHGESFCYGKAAA